MAHCSLFSRDKFVWLDETGSDNRDHIRKYGYALRGMRPVTHRFLSRGRRTNAIAAMSQDGMIALELVSGAVDGGIFFDAIQWNQFTISVDNGQLLCPPRQQGEELATTGWYYHTVSTPIQP